MASLAQQLGSLTCPPISSTRLSKHYFKRKIQKPNSLRVISVASASVGISNAETRERQRMRQMFQEARERCLTDPMDGVSFTEEDFHSTFQNCFMDIGMGDKMKGTVSSTERHGAVVDINWKFPAFLPVEESCIHNISHVEEAGIVPGMLEEFKIVGNSIDNGSLILSLREVQYDLAWERCRQLQTEDVVVKGKVVGAKRSGIVAMVEGLPGFVPFSQLSTKSEAQDLFGKEIPLKFMEVDEEDCTLVLSNSKAMADSQEQLEIGSVVVGTVQSLKEYGAFVDIGGMNGLLHISQISHDRVDDIATVLQPGDTLKVMILSHDKERGRLSLSTKKLEPTPGDMIHNPELVFEKAEEMAHTFRKRIAQAEAMARADMLRFQPESGFTLSSDGILGILAGGLPIDRLDLTDIPPAEEL